MFNSLKKVSEAEMETILMLADNVLEKMDGLPIKIVVKLPDEQKRAMDKYAEAARMIHRDYYDDVMPRFVYNAALKQLSACSAILDAIYRGLDLNVD